ncbi:hypothetical protein M3650_18360 [Paenibacillus sp. MER TA 81-3]|uniref:hypothetical protein n=1 Tax=Paenibacillus sp. MER TA 81-3 TaxID=2939573 RepID=UPI0020412137|nr:hypothetical protein [Paenibacillus sp. MER TA 81-3]MCM3340548.1 hypothetical protein [Paenibacillus sp. MER TA 81-3]
MTKEEFYADLAKATNRTIEQVRKEEEQKNQSFADQTFYYSRMSKTIDLGKGVKAEYGVDTKQERIMFGGAAGRRIVEVYKDTAYLKAATSGGYTIEKDFVNPVLEDEHNLVLRASGTSVVATTKGYNSSLNVSVEALLGIGYSLGETIENTKYYRKNFEETARFKVS